MRTLLAVVIFLGGAFALNSSADAGPKYKRGAKPSYYAWQQDYRLREQEVCEERAQHADAGRYFAGYPCWAREAFAPRDGATRDR